MEATADDLRDPARWNALLTDAMHDGAGRRLLQCQGSPVGGVVSMHRGPAIGALAHVAGSSLLARLEGSHCAIASRCQETQVQAAFGVFASELGFTSEARGLFAAYENRAVRPDYYHSLDGTGILMEVERGKTTINNMDFLDFWKCHLCEHANYLFIMAPQELRQNPTMSPRREYNTVVKRMASFFTQRNYTIVRGPHIFGY